jgi:hypothetical protein
MSPEKTAEKAKLFFEMTAGSYIKYCGMRPAWDNMEKEIALFLV